MYFIRIIRLTSVYIVRIIMLDVGMDSRQIIKELRKDGWYEVAHVGSHRAVQAFHEEGASYSPASEKRSPRRNSAEH